ncbi:hypothetical protein HGI30_02185 [Paenibacillus albicereus]|uniref:DUF2642 domain-containing protein n=1 Tax=Paenibacillus albicereus TaxID=2726185 RepID=A0A6H2GTM2_9BACL|nr:hypothetical protein [Paenibacillus albicereus]QJC50516.1 hypothetical protein HGI30_02185 [Paenibacillus albicereus]
MLDKLIGKKVLIHFLDGTLAENGVLEQADDKFVKYVTDYQELYIPITSIRTISLPLKEREKPKVGFA